MNSDNERQKSSINEDSERLRKELDELRHVEEKMSMNTALLQAIHQAQSKFIGNHSTKDIFDNLLTKLLNLTQSEYGFIGEVKYAANNTPYLKTYAITNIAWNAETRKFIAKTPLQVWNSTICNRSSAR